jgi:hypothetical protein
VIWERLASALRVKCGFEATDINGGANQTRILGRVPTNRMPDWLFVLDSIDTASGEHWTCDLSKKYFRRQGRLVYAWRLIFQGENVELYVDNIVSVVNGAARSARQELTEFPLIGSDPSRNEPLVPGKRGAGLTGQVRTGGGAK